MHLHYTFRDGQGVYVEELQAAGQDSGRGLVVSVYDSSRRRLTAVDVLAGVEVGEPIFYICGPEKMISQFGDRLARAGVARSQIRSEAFRLF